MPRGDYKDLEDKDLELDEEEKERRKREYREKLAKAGWGRGRQTLEEMSKPFNEPAFKKLRDFFKKN